MVKLLNLIIVYYRSNHFEITPTEGIVNLTQKIDREKMPRGNNTLDLIVIAEDGGTPPLNGTAVITVTVNDINDHEPQFDGDYSTFIITFNENETPMNFYTAKVSHVRTSTRQS